jgi:hypothetical protein
MNNTMFSPIDIGPSPVTSNGTDATEIEDEVSEDIHEGGLSPPNTTASADSQATVSYQLE